MHLIQQNITESDLPSLSQHRLKSINQSLIQFIIQTITCSLETQSTFCFVPLGLLQLKTGMSHAAGFQETRLPRQGKQPPELALTLDNSETATSNILHTLTLLQSPHSRHNPSPASPSQGQRQQSAAQLQQHFSQSNTPARGSQGPEPSGSNEGELLSADDMQVTDDTATPAMPAEVETAADSGTGAEAAAVPQTPMAHAGQAPEGQPDLQAVAQGRCCSPRSHLFGLKLQVLDQFLIGHTQNHFSACSDLQLV